MRLFFFTYSSWHLGNLKHIDAFSSYFFLLSFSFPVSIEGQWAMEENTKVPTSEKKYTLACFIDDEEEEEEEENHDTFQTDFSLKCSYNYLGR